jgi:hypothetical protein
VPGPFQYFIWVICSLLEAGVVVSALAKHSFRRYLPLSFYMGFRLLKSVIDASVLTHYGLTSTEYKYTYFYGDALLTICLYLVVLHLFSHVFDEMGAERYLRFGASLLLAGTAVFSYLTVHQAGNRLMTRFVVEMSQNLYFIGLVLTYVLWGAMLKLRESRTQLVQLVLSLGIHFSAFAANYAVANLRLHAGILVYLTQLIGIWLPAAWTYTLLRTPADARLVPARLATVVTHR